MKSLAGLELLKGCIDVISSAGFLDGWALDDTQPLKPLHIVARAIDRDIASGVANRYRHDLAIPGFSTGWCSYRIKLSATLLDLQDRPISLHDLETGEELVNLIPQVALEPEDDTLRNIPEIVKSDPTIIQYVEQLSGCDEIFHGYIEYYGLDEFVRCAFRYVLGRPGDLPGVDAYCSHLRDQSLSPFGLIRALYESDEFRIKDIQLAAPPAPGFPFRFL
jgi:hypothetical protein